MIKGLILVLVVIGLLTYSNSLWNPFVWDDQVQIVQNKFVHSPVNLGYFLVSSIKDPTGEGGILDFYYKPLLFGTYAILYSIGGGSTFPFHLLQVGIHIVNSMLLLLLFKRWIHYQVSLLLALIFLVHPVVEESVAYIANLQDVLFFGFGLGSLLLLVYKPLKGARDLVWSAFLIFLSLLSKETGILFIPINLVYLWLFDKNHLVRTGLVYLFTLLSYGVMRVVASSHYFLEINPSPVMKLGFIERIGLIPSLLHFYLSELVLPSERLVYVLSRVSVIESWGIIVGLVMTATAILKLTWNNKYRSLIFFFGFWVILGLGVHLQIFPLDATLARRWLYLPLAGILGLIGVLVLNLKISSKVGYILLCGVGIIIGLLAWQTFRMNSFWQDPDKIKFHTYNPIDSN